MRTQSDIERLTQKTQRYWYEDGFQDMGFGAFILVLGLAFLGQAFTPPGSPLWLVWGIGVPLLLVSGGVLIGKVVMRLKERVTFPRTGYVTYPKARGKSRLFRLLVALIVSAGISASVVVIQKNWLMLTMILGLVYAAVFTFLAYRFALRRYLALGLWSLAVGFAVAVLPLTQDQTNALFHIGTGAVWIGAGWLTWRQYNARAPLPGEANHDAQSG